MVEEGDSQACSSGDGGFGEMKDGIGSKIGTESSGLRNSDEGEVNKRQGLKLSFSAVVGKLPQKAVGSSEEEVGATQGEKDGGLSRCESGSGSVEASMASDEGVVNKSPRKKASYSAVVGKSSQLIKRDVVIEKKDGVEFSVIPSDILADAKPIWSHILIGRFVDKAPPLAIIHKIVNQIWKWGNPDVKIEVFVVGVNTVKFIIRNESARMKVLNRRMWNIARVPMLVEKCAPKSELDDEVVTILPVWITMSDVPRSLYHDKGLGYLASRIGAPMKLHMDTLLCNNFEEAKVLVEADINQDFPTSHRFVSEDGLDVVIKFSYPWLPMKCKTCSGWGHSFRACPNKEVVDSDQQGNKEVVDSDQQGKDVAEQVATQTDKIELPLIQKESSEERNLSEAGFRLDVVNVVDAISKEVVNVIDHVSMEKILTANPLFEKCEGDEHKDELGWQKARSPSRRTQHNIEEDRSIVSPTQFDCLADTTEEGEIRVEEETEQIDKSLKVGGKKETVKSNSNNITVRATRSSSKGSRGAKSGNVRGGRVPGKKPS